MLLLLRGHIRNSFTTPDLYNLVKTLYEKYSVIIYIQTWSVFSNGISWRHIEKDTNTVTEDVIRAYFKDIPIKKILIIDDTKITLVGTRDPNRGWRNMWYGKAALATLVKDSEPDDSILINTRFDLMTNSNRFSAIDTLEFIERNRDGGLHGAIFVTKTPTTGIDNIYIITVEKNHILSLHFRDNLEMIIDTPNYAKIEAAEKLVFYENARIFGTTPLAIFRKLGKFRR